MGWHPVATVQLHLHTNSTQNTKNETYIAITKCEVWSAGRAPSVRVIPWHLPYNWGKSTEKPQGTIQEQFKENHGTRRFITALTSARHLSQSWASPIQSTSHLLEIHPNIIHPSTPRSPQWRVPSGFPTETLYAPVSSPFVDVRNFRPRHLLQRS